MQVRLTTTGRETGKARTVTLYAFETAEGALVITASWGGSARNPAWVHNLRAEPHATVTVGGEERSVVAREAAGAGAGSALDARDRGLPAVRDVPAAHEAAHPAVRARGAALAHRMSRAHPRLGGGRGHRRARGDDGGRLDPRDRAWAGACQRPLPARGGGDRDPAGHDRRAADRSRRVRHLQPPLRRAAVHPGRRPPRGADHAVPAPLRGGRHRAPGGCPARPRAPRRAAGARGSGAVRDLAGAGHRAAPRGRDRDGARPRPCRRRDDTGVGRRRIDDRRRAPVG